MINKEKAREIIGEILAKAQSRFAKELEGENDEILDRELRKYRSLVSNRSWKNAQKWSKWDEDGPVLMPDFARIYYRKGKTEVVLLECPPQIRLLKFYGSLCKRENTSEEIAANESDKVHAFSLALPYVIFLFRFRDGTFDEVKCAFSDRPLKKLEEKPLRPYLSNIDNSLKVCLGNSFKRDQLIKNNVAQQVAYVLSHFWQTVYTDEWSQNFWNLKAHFSDDKRMATLDGWQEASLENPLFVVEDVAWQPHEQENFGDLIASMFEGDQTDLQFREELYDELVKNFFDEFKKTLLENIRQAETTVKDSESDALAEHLLSSLK